MTGYVVYRRSDERGNEMGAHILNEVEVWRFHFKSIFPYLRISNAPPRCNRIERASKRARIGGRSRSFPAPLLPPARPLTAVASMHASVTAAAFIIARKCPHPLLPPSFLRRPLDYGKRREGLRRSGGRTRTVGRIEGGSRRECGVPCRRGFTCSAFFREAARSKETSRGRPRGRGRPTVNSIPGRRVRQWAGAGAIER